MEPDEAIISNQPRALNSHWTSAKIILFVTVSDNGGSLGLYLSTSSPTPIFQDKPA